MDRKRKELAVARLRRNFSQSGAVVVARNRGLTAAEMAALRRQVRAAGGRLQVAKNRLALLAIKGTRFEPIGSMLRGPCALAYCTDPVETAKVVVEYARKSSNLEIVGASIAGDTLPAERVTDLTELPSLEALRSRLIGLLRHPSQNLAGVLARPGQDLLTLLREPGAGLTRLLTAYGSR